MATVNLIAPLFFSLAYPKTMKGRIDCLGNISLEVDSFGFALFRTMPEEFDAELSDDGTLQVFTKKRSSDFLQNHRYLIHKIASSFAFSSPKELERFLETKDELMKMIEEERSIL